LINQSIHQYATDRRLSTEVKSLLKNPSLLLSFRIAIEKQREQTGQQKKKKKKLKDSYLFSFFLFSFFSLFSRGVLAVLPKRQREN